MNHNFFRLTLLFILLSTLSYASTDSNDAMSIQTNFPTHSIYVPNRAGKSLSTPTGWGASNNTIFIGAGGTTPQAYTETADGSISFGLGLGDSLESIGLELSVSLSDFSTIGEPSYGLKLHKYLGYGLAFAVAGEHLFHADTSDADESFYSVISRTSQNHSNDAGISKFHYSLGAGNGRFGEKSPMDQSQGKGEHGTYVFGSTAYEIFPDTNFIIEWTGINVNIGISTAPLKNIPMAVTIGIGDLIKQFSGDGARVFGSIGFSYQFR